MDLGWLSSLTLAVAVAGPSIASPAARDDAAAEQGPTESAPLEPAEAESDDDEADEADDDRRVVEVTTRADDLTATGRTVSRDTIANTPTRSAEDLMRLVPGMLIVQHGNQGKGHQFYLRGFDAVHGSDVEVTLEGIPINEPSNVHAHGYLDLSFIIPEVVRSLDARKGAFRLDQGNFATAGSVGYHLGVRDRDRGTRIGYEIGSTNRHRAVIVHAPRDRPEETFVAVEAMHDDGYGENRRAQRVSTMGQARLWSRRGVSVDALTTAYGARFGLPGTIRLDDFNRDAVGFFDAYRADTAGHSARGLAGLHLAADRGVSVVDAVVYGEARRLVLDENFTGFLQFPELGDRHRQRHDALRSGVNLDYEVEAHDRVRLRLVGSWQGNLIDQREDRLLAGGRPFGVSRDLGIRQHAFGAGPGLRLLPARWLYIDGGVRFDAFHYTARDALQDGRTFNGTEVTVSPRLATRFRIRERWQIFASYGRGFRSPEARAFTLPPEVPPDADLDRFAGGEPSISVADTVEVGARFRPNDLFDMGSAVFGTWIARESIFDHVSGFNVELGPTRRLGIEADAHLHPASWLDLGADITGVHARFTETGAPIPAAPSLLTSVFGTLVHPSGWRAGLRWFLVGPRALTYGARAGVMTVLDASVGYRHDRFDIGLTADNLLGLRWKEGEYNFASHWDQRRTASQIPTLHYIAGYPFMARLQLTLWL